MNALTQLITRLTDRGPILHADRPHWAATRNLEDLCARTVDWLEGRIQSQPGYYGPVDVDEDTAPGLTAALTACNRAGFLTADSQAGTIAPGYDRAGWVLHAAVTGYTSPAVWARIEAAVAGSRRFGAFAYPAHAGRGRRRQGVPVTFRQGRPVATYGRPLTASEVAFLYEGCGSAAVAEVVGALQVTVWDTEPGVNDLWGFLSSVLTSEEN